MDAAALQAASYAKFQFFRQALIRAGVKIKSYQYSYKSSYAIGWLLLPLNALVTPFNDTMYSTVGGCLGGVEPAFLTGVARINRWILKDFQEVHL
jgi:hypothetical protein